MQSRMWGVHSKQARYRALVAAIYVSVAALVAISLFWQARQDEASLTVLARERGAVLFRLVELTCNSNAQRGGIYVPATRNAHSSPEGVRFHITSLKPIRPTNGADAWETESLRMFEQREAGERLSFFPGGDGGLAGPVHRYMAPLFVEPACLKCHADQGYKTGDVRGGISIVMPSGKLIEIADAQRKHMMWVYVVAFFAVAGLGHFVAWHTRRHVLALETINRNQEATIAERTCELSVANDALQKEVGQVAAAQHGLQLAATVFERAAEGIMVTDSDNRIIQVNPAFTAITGFSAEEAIGMTPRFLKSGHHDKHFYEKMWRQLTAAGRWEGEIWNRRKSGEVYVAWLSVTTVPGATAGEGHYVATFIDITKRKQAEEIILHKANYDALTDIPNRHLFDDRLNRALAMARRRRRNVALMYIDLDYFKAVNDTLGHAAGDGLLAEAARRMANCVRAVDTVARFGGDEFAVILTDLDEVAEVEEVARRLINALAQPYGLVEGVAHVTASIGVAVYPRDGTDDLLLRKSADEALYAAKAEGRNTYRFAIR